MDGSVLNELIDRLGLNDEKSDYVKVKTEKVELFENRISRRESRTVVRKVRRSNTVFKQTIRVNYDEQSGRLFPRTQRPLMGIGSDSTRYFPNSVEKKEVEDTTMDDLDESDQENDMIENINIFRERRNYFRKNYGSQYVNNITYAQQVREELGEPIDEFVPPNIHYKKPLEKPNQAKSSLIGKAFSNFIIKKAQFTDFKMTDLEIAKEKASKANGKKVRTRTMTKEELGALKQIQEDYNKLTPEELDLVSKEAIIIQCGYRRFKAKKIAKKLVKKRYQRNKCATELLQTEESYVRDLSSVVNFYIEPLYKIAEEKPKLLKKADLDTIFADLPLMLKVNKIFLEGCRKELSNYNHFETKISTLFADIVHYFKLYTNYCNNYDRATKKVKELRKNSKVNQLIYECTKDPRHHRKGWALSSFLILPIQRIPRYRLLIRDLIKQTDREHPDYESLIEASKNIDSVAAHLNITMRSNQMKRELSEMQSRFTFPDDLNFEIVQPHRHFIQKDEFKDAVTLHLFNDVCIISTQNKGIFNFKALFPLENTALFNWHNSAKKEYHFKLKTAKTEVIVHAKTLNQKQKWLTDIYMAIQELRDNKGTAEVLVNEDEKQTAMAQALDTELNMSPKECVNQIKDNVHVLLKFGRQGKPHYRNFQLSRDCRCVCWLSKKNTKAPTTIPLIDKEKRLAKLLLGQQTEVFKQSDFWRRADKTKTSLSFSLLYKTSNGQERTLDLVATNRKQYLTWVTALQFILDPRSNFHMGASVEGPGLDIAKLRKQKKMKFKDAGRASKNDQMQKIGDLYSWGSNVSGGLGINSQEHNFSPIVMQEFLYLDVEDVFVGKSVAFATMTSGVLFSWGSGDYGKSGHGDNLDRLNPAMVQYFKEHKLQVKAVALGEDHTLVLTRKGKVYAFGRGHEGQLGICPEPVEQQLEPMLVEGIKRKSVVSIACGAQHSAALTRTGELFLWGRAAEGQLGDGQTTNSFEPVQLRYPANVTWMELACGTWHTLSLTDKGHLYAWGDNSFGQCGILPTRDDDDGIIQVPRVVPEFSATIVSIHCGHTHSVVLDESGTLYTWGSGQYGQLGDGRIGHKAIAYTPQKITSISKVRQVVCGFSHTMALTHENAVYGWGANTKGRIGIKTEDDISVPTEIAFFEKRRVRAISAGYHNSFAVCAHQWVPDSDVVGCMKCSKKFTNLYRRHHCRYCGGVFCKKCSSDRIHVLRFGFHGKKVRVCRRCFEIISAEQGGS